jgi:hypothetical protein
MAEDRTGALPCPRIVPGQKRLTAGQRAYAQQFDQACIAAVRSTVEMDEAEGEAYLRQAYLVAGFPPPRIRWFDSPMAFLLAHGPPNVAGKMGIPVEDREAIGIEMPVEDMVNTGTILNWLHEVSGHLDAEDREIIGNLGGEVYGELWATKLDSAVRESLLENVLFDTVSAYLEGDSSEREWVWDSIGRSITSYYYASDLARVRFCHEVVEPNDFIHFARFNELVSGYHLGQEEAWVVHKPTRLFHDEYGRWHCADGRCLHYRDGWGFYAWHGALVPEKLILHPEQLTKEEWLAEPNLEVRRVMQERLGSLRFVELVGGTCIDQGARGELIAVGLFDDTEGVAHYIHVRDASTQRQYYLRVPPSIRRADEAVAWTFGLSEQEYEPRQET